MTCNEFKKQFRAYFWDNKGNPRQEQDLADHLVVCAECRMWKREFYKNGLKWTDKID